MDKEEILIQKRLIELSRTAFHRGIVTYSDFLNLNEQQVLHQTPKNMLPVSAFLYGGYVPAERCQVAFIPSEVVNSLGIDLMSFQNNPGTDSDETSPSQLLDFPISCLLLEPLQKKFAEALSHRDYLGALLNLGIERHKTGDILVEESRGYLFVDANLSSFICDNLTKIRHTSVKVTPAQISDFKYEARFESRKGNVASVRLDALIGLAYNLARGKSCAYIETGKVFVNNRLVSSNGYKPQENDIISIRGVGRFAYRGITAETRKGRFFVELNKYI